MKLGIVGLPNVGKSTLFNAITQAGAESANYPFCTIEPNVGVVSVPDERLEQLAKMYNFKWFGRKNTDELRGENLNEIYAKTKIVVGDSVYSPYYWSNRVVETLGRGGFLIHRDVPGIKEEYPDLVTYDGTMEDLLKKIDYYLSHEEERQEIIRKNFEHVRDHYTMDKKCEELITWLNQLTT